MYSNFPRVQSYNQKELQQLGLKSLDFPVETIEFNLMQQKNERISLSWRLTQAEKLKIEGALNNRSNQNSLKKILEILND